MTKKQHPALPQENCSTAGFLQDLWHLQTSVNKLLHCYLEVMQMQPVTKIQVV